MSSAIYHLKHIAGGILLAFVLPYLSSHLQAQNFKLGLFGYDQPLPGRVLNAHEQTLILGTNSNFMTGCISRERQEDFIDFGDTTNDQFTLEADPAGQTYYAPYYPGNICLSIYICENDSAAIDPDSIALFINNVHTAYPNDPGLGAILVAHQGRSNQADHWPFIQQACSLISVNYGDNVQSIVINNAFQYPGTNLVDFYDRIDSLDVFLFEYYPFLSNRPALSSK